MTHTALISLVFCFLLAVFLRKRNANSLKGPVDLPKIPIYVSFPNEELSKLQYSAINNASPSANIELLKKIGKGEFGVVWAAKWNGINVAIKFFENMTPSAKEEQMKEFEIMKYFTVSTN